MTTSPQSFPQEKKRLKSLKKTRQSVGFSVAALAQEIGYTKMSLYSWESGRSVPSKKAWELIKEALKIKDERDSYFMVPLKATYPKQCAANECDKKSISKGYCSTHYSTRYSMANRLQIRLEMAKKKKKAKLPLTEKEKEVLSYEEKIKKHNNNLFEFVCKELNNEHVGTEEPKETIKLVAKPKTTKKTKRHVTRKKVAKTPKNRKTVQTVVEKALLSGVARSKDYLVKKIIKAFPDRDPDKVEQSLAQALVKLRKEREITKSAGKYQMH